MDFDMNKMVAVKNRSAGLVVYKIPEHNIRREFNMGETKQIPYQELVWLSYRPGGRTLMAKMLLIQEHKVTEELNIPTEPEYFMTEPDIIQLLQHGSVDELKDALDFAPEGVIDIIKKQAVALPIYDVQKRDAIQKATGFNVTLAIENSQPDEDEAPAESHTPTRRVQKNTEVTSAPERRTQPREYKVITPNAE
jgi:hypothetical protein